MNREKAIIKYLSQGFTQYEIAEKLREKGIGPSSLSAIEKTLAALRKEYKAANSFHLAVILCRKGII